MLASMLVQRFAAALIAVVTIAMSGCASNDSEPAPSTTNARPDCHVDAPENSGIDIAFEDMDGFAVTPICPKDLHHPLWQENTEFHELNSAEISEGGRPVLRVLVGQLSAGSGDGFVDQFLADLATIGEAYAPPKVLASGPPQDLGGYEVRSFHMFQVAEGYAYTDGPIAVVAYNRAGPRTDAAEAAFVKIVNNVHLR
jgi:hypothetical protein